MRFLPLLLILCCLSLCAQEQAKSDNPPPKATGSVSATTRLLNAKTVFVKKVAGDDMAFDIVNNAIIGWPRYIVVDSPEKADLLIEVSSPEAPKKDKDGGTTVSGSAGGRDPRAMQMPTSTYSSTDVKLIVRDAHTKAILWAGTEPAKEAFRQAKTDQNLIDATRKLVRKLQDRVEPQQPPPAP
jgi:hypothetical protein